MSRSGIRRRPAGDRRGHRKSEVRHSMRCGARFRRRWFPRRLEDPPPVCAQTMVGRRASAAIDSMVRTIRVDHGAVKSSLVGPRKLLSNGKSLCPAVTILGGTVESRR